METETFDPNKIYCTFLEFFDKKFALKINESCWEHDQAYVMRLGPRIEVDLYFIRQMAKVDEFRAYFYGFFILLFGWILWYDIDIAIRDFFRKIF